MANEFAPGDYVRFKTGDVGKILDVLIRTNGSPVLEIQFVKNVFREQRPEMHEDYVLALLDPATEADWQAEVERRARKLGVTGKAKRIAAPRPKRELTPFQIEQNALLSRFSELTHIPEPLRTTKDFVFLWATPSGNMISTLNGKSLLAMEAAIAQMERGGLTIHSPASVLKVTIGIGRKMQDAPHSETGETESERNARIRAKLEAA
jgi:hypothetical protein